MEIVVQFFKVGEIDTLKEQFNADVIVKAKWREPTFDGQQSTAVCYIFKTNIDYNSTFLENKQQTKQKKSRYCGHHSVCCWNYTRWGNYM